MSSNPQSIQDHLERGSEGSSEKLVFDQSTGRFTVKPKHEPLNPDRFVALDMNKAGPGGFFRFDEHVLLHGGLPFMRQ